MSLVGLSPNTGLQADQDAQAGIVDQTATAGIGTTLHWRADNGCRAAIIVGVHENVDVLDLVVFTAGGVYFITDVVKGEATDEGFWHWPDEVRAVTPA